ncbi:hypothetical protein SCP_1201510 [Sparassis crispa]|uniref:Zn(2)-C6 fungal-type domain-containing protein n=1 Tax=Sparassis crispa TaxID=139825 RepID=A0A401H0H0_9APHY|nr:hypothetical protein SCP_1201510 [Sparassis crispa]GBE87925.1 hypothetical protein SCP_1201510 [Sparassis crispa]
MASEMRPGPSSSSSRAPRGSACLSCRRRKLRCDGLRPKCTPCIRGNREEDCEYTDGSARSAIQLLEDEIARLEARIYELEHPDSVTAPIILHDPRAVVESQPQSSAANSEQFGGLVSHSSTVQTVVAEPTLQMIQALVGNFKPYASQIGFFLHELRFLEALYEADPGTKTAILPPALLNVIYLWGVRLSTNNSLAGYESVFLSRASQGTSAALASVPTYRLMHVIQAEVLLATYFFATGRLLEGRYHCSAAVALALSGRLNQIRGVVDHMSHVHTAHGIDIQLPPPTDAVEEGERVNAFWTVYLLDKSWTVPLGSPSHINGGADLNIPWPLEMENYEEGGFAPNILGVRTIESFLNNTPSSSGSGTSSLALHAKAAALYERATRLSSHWSPTMANAEEFFANVALLDSVIDHFTASLRPIEAATSPHVARDLLVTHSLARAATIQLYARLSEAATGPRGTKKLIAAKASAALLNNINLNHSVYINPILAMIWTTVCRVLIEELSRLRPGWTSSLLLVGNESASADPLQNMLAAQAQLNDALENIFRAMSVFSRTSPVMASQLTKIRQKLEEATR